VDHARHVVHAFAPVAAMPTISTMMVALAALPSAVVGMASARLGLTALVAPVFVLGKGREG
jgi:hypothetical protein